jgi:hypothetical protein
VPVAKRLCSDALVLASRATDTAVLIIFRLVLTTGACSALLIAVVDVVAWCAYSAVARTGQGTPSCLDTTHTGTTNQT